MHIDWALTGVTAVSVVKLVIMALVGVLASKMGILDETGTTKVTKLLLNVIIPMMLLSSYFTEFNSEMLSNMLYVFAATFIVHMVCIGVIRIFIRKKNNPNFEVESGMALMTNCGCIGIPLVSMILGPGCVFFVSSYMTINSFFVWIYLPLLLSGKVTKQNIKKAFLSPCLIAIYIGLILFFTKTSPMLPEMITEPISKIGNCSAPVAMMLSGATVARSDIKGLLKNPRTYLVCFVRLIVCSLITIPIVLLLGMPTDVALAVHISHAAGAGFATVMIAEDNGKDAGYCAGLMAMATILCIITIPVVVAVFTLFT